MDLREDLLREISSRQLDAGGWAALSSSKQAVVESTCLVALAAGAHSALRQQAQRFLLGTQNPDGSWPAFLGDDQEGTWVTSLAVLALADCGAAISARLRGYEWLVRSCGKEANWFSKWKFRTLDRQIRFDPDQYGWPWIPDTLSWVVPTGFCMLALDLAPSRCAGLGAIRARLERGTKMLLDRACVNGGWNAGNSMVCGEPLPPHADDTAIALLALYRRNRHPAVQLALEYLEAAASNLQAPTSLAWAVLALAAHGKPVTCFAQRLLQFPVISKIADTGAVAAVCLALDWQNGLVALGIWS
jgi:hypothetical protein